MRPLATLVTLVFLSATPGPAGAQARLTANTLGLADGDEPGRAGIEDVSWISGHWVGEALGGISEEIWSGPAAGTMMGVYRLIRGDEVAFYEVLSISEEDGSLVLRLKHFDRQLRGWEEKEETVDFPLVRVDEESAYFSGMTFRRRRDDGLVIYLALEGPDGSMREESFEYRRADR